MRYKTWRPASLGIAAACFSLVFAGAMIAGADALAQPAAQSPQTGSGDVDLPERALPDLVYQPIPLPDPDQQEVPLPDLPAGEAEVIDLRTREIHTLEDMGDPAMMALTDWLPGGSAIPETEPIDDGGEKNFSGLQRVANPTAGRYPTHVKLFMSFRDQSGVLRGYVGSGTLIDPYHVVTCGHCIYAHSDQDNGWNFFDWAESVTVVPAYDSGTGPYGSADATHLMSWTGWTQNGDLQHDVGLISLDRPIGATAGWRGVGYNENCSFFTSSTWWHNGYPAAPPYNGSHMYTQLGDFDGCSGSSGFARFNRRSYGGQSGSGAVKNDVVWAVLSNGNTTYTNDARISSTKFFHIVQHIQDDLPDQYDLMPLAMNVPAASAYSGDALAGASFLVLNYSEAQRSGTWSYTVYLSTNTDISTSDVPIGTSQFSHNFSPRGRTTVSVPSMSIPDDLPSGQYHVGVIVNASDARIYNNDSSGPETDAISITCPQPSTPNGLTASDDQLMQVTVSWHAATRADQYRVLRNGSEIAEITATHLVDHDVAPGVNYSYRVVAVNDCGQSSPSVAATGACICPVPVAVDGLTASDDLTLRIEVDWELVAGADQYRLYRDGSLLDELVEAAYEDLDVEPHRTYLYHVIAFNECGPAIRH